MAQTQDTELRAALSALETALSTPIISGELAAWIAEAQKAWSEASAQVHYSLKHLHPRQYEEMANADLELLPRVDQLKAEDATIEREREHLQQAIARAAEHLPKLEPDEGKAQKHVEGLIDHGLAFVTRVRKQEVAVETWLVEAFNRDRGAVD